jgi:DNA topoisomerase IB
VARLRRADCSRAGITRRRRGRGFEYRDPSGALLQDEEALVRIRALAIPPAWTDVWICTDPHGHLQATGVDAAGRKQYRYHDRWRERRDREKFDRMLDFADRLPDLRHDVVALLDGNGLSRERVLACAVRLLDLGFFRIGTEAYAETNETFGLATMRRAHVRLGASCSLTFDYPAKGGKRRLQSVVDPGVYAVVEELKRRRGSPELLAWQADGRTVDVTSDAINDFIRERAGGPFTAKDFRTWNATVLAAVSLAVASPAAVRTPTARKRAKSLAVREVSRYLGNTPAVCRASYIDPRVFDRFDAGVTVVGALDHLGGAGSGLHDVEAQDALDRAVLALLEERYDEPDVERVDPAEPLAVAA